MHELIGDFFSHPGLFDDLCPEVMGMRPYSIDAAIRRRDHHCKHLSLDPTERRWTIQNRKINLHRSFQHLWILTHDPDNVPDAPGPFDGGIIFGFELSRGLFRLNYFYPRHALIITWAK